MQKGSIFNKERYVQLLDFSGLQFERGITPTDYDMVLDLGQTEWIVGEIKTRGTMLPRGQRRCITNDLLIHHKQGIKSLGIVAYHDAPPGNTIMVASLIVSEFWLSPDKGWQIPVNKWTVRQFIDRWRQMNR